MSSRPGPRHQATQGSAKRAARLQRTSGGAHSPDGSRGRGRGRARAAPHPWQQTGDPDGTGGVGKTRLATAVARAAVGDHHDGVVMVHLASSRMRPSFFRPSAGPSGCTPSRAPTTPWSRPCTGVGCCSCSTTSSSCRRPASSCPDCSRTATGWSSSPRAAPRSASAGRSSTPCTRWRSRAGSAAWRRSKPPPQACCSSRAHGRCHRASPRARRRRGGRRALSSAGRHTPGPRACRRTGSPAVTTAPARAARRRHGP